MQTKINIVPVILLLSAGIGCSKVTPKSGSVASVTLVNAVTGTNPIIAEFSNVPSIAAYYSTTAEVSFGSFNDYSVPSGPTPAAIYEISDTLIPIYQTNEKSGAIIFQPNAIYSLFLCGQLTQDSTADTLLTLDLPPYYPASDSVTGVRFVNLLEGSNPVSVSQPGLSNGSEVTSLSYKGISAFRPYAASSAVSQYVFVFRDS